jgi:hypothetical protein
VAFTGLLTFTAASALVAASATLGVSLLPLRRAIDVALAWALLASAVVVVTLLVAGAVLDELAAWLVLLINAVVTALLAIATVLVRPRPSLTISFRALHAWLGEVRADAWLLLLVLAVAVEAVWRLFVAYVMPPYAGDALWYHLTTVAEWLQSGRIAPSDLSIWSSVYPHNGELLFTWPALLLGTDTFVDAVQLPFAIVAAVAVAGIAQTAGLSRADATAAGALFFLTPIVLSQTSANYTDVIFLAFFLAAFHFLLRFLSDLRTDGTTPTRTNVSLAGLAAGLAFGTKGLGFPYVGVLTVLLVAHVVVGRWTHRVTTRAALWSLTLFVLPLLALGTYHYVEVWARYGNPVHPIGVAVLGRELFSGVSLDWFLSSPPTDGPWWREVWGQWHRDHFFLVEPRFHAYSYAGLPSGLGPLWSYLALPLLIVFAVRLARSNRPLFVNLILPIAAMFALQPYRWWSRFTMVLAALGAIAIVAILAALPTRWANALKVFVLALVALGIAFPTLKIDGEFWATDVVALAGVPAHERTVGRVALPGYRWVDAAPPGTSIGVDTAAGYVGAQPYILPYPLFGPRFENRVHALPHASEGALWNAIADNSISYVYVAHGRRLDRWLERSLASGCVLRVYEGPVYAGHSAHAYQIVRPNCRSRPAAADVGA